MRKAILLLLVACDDPGAAIDVVDARVARQADHRVTVEVDVTGHEGLGGNIGTYCTRVTFPAQTLDHCEAALKDGDTKTLRFVSDGDLEPGASIGVRVRLGPQEIGRSLAAPPR